MKHAVCAPGVTRERVLSALDAVIDPELDEPITSLRFVASVEVGDGGDVAVALRLPTPQCAPNFAFLMAADARRAVRGVPGVGGVVITLEDHYTGDEINTAVNRGSGFTGAFPGETDDDELDALRELFQRKALVGRQARLCEALLEAGATAEAVTAMTLGDLPVGAERDRCLELRAALDLRADPHAPAFVTPAGDPVTADGLTRWLRMARLIRTSLEANGGLCRSMLRFRYELDDDEQEERG